MKRILSIILLVLAMMLASISTLSNAEIILQNREPENKGLETRELYSQIRIRGHPGITPSPEAIQMYRIQGSSPPRVADWPAPVPKSPVTGTRNILVIRIDFSDCVGTQSQSYFNNLVFGSSQGQMKHYYTEVSYGQLNIVGVVTATWYRSAHTMVYWGSDSASGIDDQNGAVFELAREAVVLADTEVDFHGYDLAGDDDDVLDPEELSICIIHAGNGQESSYVLTDIWSHRWYIFGQGYDYLGTPLSDTIVDSVRVSKHPDDYAGGYFMQAETSPMGTFAHEFGHDLGLPDLYDTDYSSEGLGVWCLMSGGSWLGSPAGTSPAHPTAWCKYKLGWITPTRIAAPTIQATVNMIETSTTQSLYILPITTGSDIEYFLIENRQKFEYDQFLPGSGVLIWHVDERQWMTQNDDENHKLVDLEEADGLNHLDLKSNSGDAADPWYNNAAGFTDTSNPGSDGYGGASTWIEVKNISPSSATMTVGFKATRGWSQIAYDDGYPEYFWSWTGAGGMFAVNFTPPFSGQLKTASFFVAHDPANFKVHVMNSSRIDLIPPTTHTPTSIGWFDVDLSAQSITVNSGVDFYIGMEWMEAYNPKLGSDDSSPDGRSWNWNGGSWTPYSSEDYMIRVALQPPSALTVSSVKTSIVEAAASSVRFIYPDYDKNHVKGNGAKTAALSDFTAMGVVYGMTVNTQLECLDTCSIHVTQSNGGPSVTGEGVTLVGGPIVHACVKYYETNRIAPIYWGMEGTTYYWYTKAGAKLTATAMSKSVFGDGITYHQDMFVVEHLLDVNGNAVFIVYGYGWKGSFAGGRYFKAVIYPDISGYTHAYYIYRWIDGNNDGFPDLNEITQVTYGD